MKYNLLYYCNTWADSYAVDTYIHTWIDKAGFRPETKSLSLAASSINSNVLTVEKESLFDPNFFDRGIRFTQNIPSMHARIGFIRPSKRSFSTMMPHACVWIGFDPVLFTDSFLRSLNDVEQSIVISNIFFYDCCTIATHIPGNI